VLILLALTRPVDMFESYVDLPVQASGQANYSRDPSDLSFVPIDPDILEAMESPVLQPEGGTATPNLTARTSTPTPQSPTATQIATQPTSTDILPTSILPTLPPPTEILPPLPTLSADPLDILP